MSQGVAGGVQPVLALVTARAGSKGIPGKNLRPAGGRPLVGWTFAAARASRLVSRVIVSTDDPDVAELSRACGVEVPFMRPSRLAADDSDHLSVVEHALDWLRDHERYEPKYLLLLQPTSPLRSAADIDAAIELAGAHTARAVVGVTEMHPHPALGGVVTADGRFRLNAGKTARRQDLTPTYALNGAIFLNQCEALRRDRTFCPPDAHAYVMPAERALDVDTPWDLRVADLVLSSPRGV